MEWLAISFCILKVLGLDSWLGDQLTQLRSLIACQNLQRNAGMVRRIDDDSNLSDPSHSTLYNSSVNTVKNEGSRQDYSALS